VLGRYLILLITTGSGFLGKNENQTKTSVPGF
jgi:hypothetical protein